MILTLHRNFADNKALLGELFVDGTHECYTLENTTLDIPASTYPVTLYNSPAHHRVVPLLQVPSRSYIEVHGGDYAKDSKGCILVAQGDTQPTTEQEFADLCSTPAVDHLVGLITGQSDVRITITDAV